jgi:heme oxygenase
MKKASEIESLFNVELKKKATEYNKIVERYSGINIALDALLKAAELADKLEDKKASEAITSILENLANNVLKDVG